LFVMVYLLFEIPLRACHRRATKRPRRHTGKLGEPLLLRGNRGFLLTRRAAARGRCKTMLGRGFKEIADAATRLGTMTMKRAHDALPGSYRLQAGSLSRISVTGAPVAFLRAIAHL
jgi:hypothetical protein